MAHVWICYHGTSPYDKHHDYNGKVFGISTQPSTIERLKAILHCGVFFSTQLPSICIIFIAVCRLPFRHKVHFYSHTLIYCQRKTLDISPKKGYFSWCLHNIFADWRIITISTSSDWKAYHSNTSSSSNQPKCIINERVRERVSCWVLCSPSNEIVYQKRAPFARHCTQTRFDSSK